MGASHGVPVVAFQDNVETSGATVSDLRYEHPDWNRYETTRQRRSAQHVDIAASDRLDRAIEQTQRRGYLIGKSECMRKIHNVIMQCAQSRSNVVIFGETGTGKELVAATIHDLSGRRKGKFVPVNCGAIPADSIETALFGYTKDAFLPAASDKSGYLDWAQGGTLFLDEIGELHLNLQVKLLRFINGGAYAPIGGQGLAKKPDIRIIAASNDDLTDRVSQKKMRQDFFYRLNILPVKLPPLRRRREDIPLLVDHFMRHNESNDRYVTMPNHLMQRCLDYDWPGNVSELHNTVRRYQAIGTISFLNLPRQRLRQGVDTANASEADTCRDGRELETVIKAAEKTHIRQVLMENSWHRGKTASILGINRKTLYKKITRYGLDRM